MSHANRTKKTEIEVEENILNKFLDHLNKKYGIDEDLILASIDEKKIKYNLERYKCEFEDIDNEIDAKAYNNNHEKPEIIDISDGINGYLDELEKKSEENTNNRNINLNSKTKKK